MFGAIVNRCQMFELVSEATPLARRILQRDAHGRVLRRAKHFIETGDDVPQSLRFARAQVRAGMKHQERQLQRAGKIYFLNK